MDKDIVPQLLESIKEDLEKGILASTKIKKLEKLLAEGKATYIEAYKYAEELGQILSKALGSNITAEILPEGKMYYNIAQRILDDTLGSNYNLISDYTSEVQRGLNKTANIRLKPQKAKINQAKIDSLINLATSKDNFEEVRYVLGSPIVHFGHDVVDRNIKANVNFHGKAGLRPKVVRVAERKCCEWCSRLDGSYLYPNVPHEVFTRHDNCRCTVDYFPGDGKKQNVWTKEIERVPTDELERRKQRNYDIKANNRREDSREYKEIVRALGEENVPVSLAQFQDLKYTDKEGYKHLKDRAYIQQKFNNGTWKDKVNPEKQARHMQSTVGEGKSYFFDDVDVEALYEQYKMTGKFLRSYNDEGNKELIDLPSDLRIGIDKYSQKTVNGFTIHYSKTGVHLVPTVHKERGKE